MLEYGPRRDSVLPWRLNVQGEEGYIVFLLHIVRGL